MNSIEELKKLRKLMQQEKLEDLELHKKMIFDTPIQDRVRSGFTWYPLRITQKGVGHGEQVYIEVERTSNLEVESQLQSSKRATLFCNHNNQEKTLRCDGVLVGANRNHLRIYLNADDFPDWLNFGKLGIDLLFDENSYKEMDEALKTVIDADRSRLSLLREILLGKDKPFFDEAMPKSYHDGLNVSQNLAVNQIVSAMDVAIVHGPPGTGKTTTLVQAIKKVLESEKQILVTAPSNTAVDVLVERLSQENIKVARIGHPARVNESLLNLTIDAQIAQHEDFAEIKALKRKSEEFKQMAFKYKRNFGREEANQRRMLQDEARSLRQEAEKLEDYILGDIMEKTQVIATTLVGANNHLLKNRTFKTVVIDEAAQALEPACWIPIIKAQRVIMAGDHQQLPPTVKSFEAGKNGLSTTLFEKTIQRTNASTLLNVQYRMNEAIMGFSSEKFYDGQLKAHESVASQQLEDEKPLEFWDTAGCGFDEKQQLTSLLNEGEASILFKHLENLLGKHPQTMVGIISPYKAQVNHLKEKLSESSELLSFKDQITIHSVDGFQGQEREVIYISMVRSNSKGEIGFLSDIRRMNVAMTRAQKKLVVIGDSATLSHFKFYQDWLEYLEKHDAHHSAWELMEV
ncbi:MAG: AAA domain-containing protein [Cytophagales bacterium]